MLVSAGPAPLPPMVMVGYLLEAATVVGSAASPRTFVLMRKKN